MCYLKTAAYARKPMLLVYIFCRSCKSQYIMCFNLLLPHNNCNSLYRKSNFCIPRNETVQPRSHFPNPIYACLFWELRGLSPNFHIHVSMSNLYILYHRICLPIWLQQNRQTDCGYLYVIIYTKNSYMYLSQN